MQVELEIMLVELEKMQVELEQMQVELEQMQVELEQTQARLRVVPGGARENAGGARENAGGARENAGRQADLLSRATMRTLAREASTGEMGPPYPVEVARVQFPRLSAAWAAHWARRGLSKVCGLCRVLTPAEHCKTSLSGVRAQYAASARQAMQTAGCLRPMPCQWSSRTSPS